MRRCILRFFAAMLSGIFASGMAYAQIEMYVGDTRLLSTPSPQTGAIFQAAWAAQTPGLEVVKSDANSATIKVKSYFSGTGNIQCDYYWRWYSGDRMYTNNATTFFRVTCKQVSVLLDKTTLSLTAGEGMLLHHRFSPVGPQEPSVRWKTSNANVATVDSRGYVKGVSGGTAVITVSTDQDTEATCQVTVIGGVAGGGSDGGNSGGSTGGGSTGGNSGGGSSGGSGSSQTGGAVSVSLPASMTVIKDYSTTLMPTVNPDNAAVTYYWSSDNTSVATVSSAGLVTAKSSGSATVTVRTGNGLSSSCRVNVVESPVEVGKSKVLEALARIKVLVTKSVSKNF